MNDHHGAPQLYVSSLAIGRLGLPDVLTTKNGAGYGVLERWGGDGGAEMNCVCSAEVCLDVSPKVGQLYSKTTDAQQAVAGMNSLQLRCAATTGL